MSVFYVSLLFCAEMVFGAKCFCLHHNTWHHGEVSPKLLPAVNPKELEFVYTEHTNTFTP